MTRLRRWKRLFHLVPWIAACLSIVVPAVTLTNWPGKLVWLNSLLSGPAKVAGGTAIGFLLAGIALITAAAKKSALTPIRRLLEATLLVIGVLALLQYAFGITLLTNLLSGLLPYVTPGYMSPTTAFGFLLVAMALISDHEYTGNGRARSRTFATLLFILALMALLGYAYGAPAFYLGVDGTPAISLTTALLFLNLAVGIIWLRSEYGFTAMLAEQSVVGTHVRALLPMVLVAPLLVGAAVAAGYGHLYEGEFALALTSLGSITAAGMVAAVSIIVLRRADNALYVRDRALAATTNGILITDHRSPEEPVIYTNAAFTNITGYSPEYMLGRNCRLLNAGVENSWQTMSALRHCIEVGSAGTFEIRNRRSDNSLFWNRLSIAPVENYEGTITHFVGIMDDVSWRREQETRLQKALQEARDANDLRDTFTRLVSHELRAPLNAALTWVRLMEVDLSPATRQKGLAVIAKSIESQSRLIDDLVDINRFQSIGVRLQPEVIDAREMIEFAVEELRPILVPAKTLTLLVEPGDYTARLDPVRLQQIVRNLVDNANKYTPEGGHIEARLAVQKDFFQLRVVDTGKGLSQEEIQQVFEPFWRADDNLPGLGVGLSIVASLVNAHHGTISVDSPGPGKGSSFVVRLPLASADLPAKPDTGESPVATDR